MERGSVFINYVLFHEQSECNENLIHGIVHWAFAGD